MYFKKKKRNKNQLDLLHQSLKDNFHMGILSELHRPIICTHFLSLMKNKSGCSYVLYLLQFSIFNLNILPSNLGNSVPECLPFMVNL